MALVVAAAGAATAFAADAPYFERHDNFNDAWREIGGATFAGAVIAILVLVYEQRREDERIDREEQREARLEAAADERAKDAATRGGKLGRSLGH